MSPGEFWRWLQEDRRISHIFDNLRTFLIYGTLALMLLNLVDGYHRIKRACGRRFSLAVLAVYIVQAMTTAKLHGPRENLGQAAHLPFAIFR